MPSLAYQFDFSGGSGSPFRALKANGAVLFDARYASLRKHGIFTAILGGNANGDPVPTDVNQLPIYSTTAFTVLPLGKTFTRRPYMIGYHGSTSLPSSNPFSPFSSNYQVNSNPSTTQAVLGAVIGVTTLTDVRAGNWNVFGVFVAMLVFDRGVEG